MTLADYLRPHPVARIARVAAIVFGVLAILLALVPPPLGLPGMRALGGPQHAWSLYALAGAGVAAVLVLIARACLPLAVLVAWMALRAVQIGAPRRTLEVLGWTVGAALAVWLLRAWQGFRCWAALALLLGGLINASLGILNLFGIYWPVALKAHAVDYHAHRPTGLLGHPNHWGLYLALTLPLVDLLAQGLRDDVPRLRRWIRPALVGTWAGLILLSLSAAATGAAAVVLVVLAWPSLSRRARAAVPVAAVLVVLALAFLRPSGDLLGGRGPYWVLAARTWWENAPVLGIGPGTYRAWALWEDGPIARGVPGLLVGQWQFRYSQTEAFSEPLQLGFELGLVGFALGGWLFATGARDVVHAVCTGCRRERAWALVLLVAMLALWVASPFHHGALTLPVVIALAYVRRPG